MFVCLLYLIHPHIICQLFWSHYYHPSGLVYHISDLKILGLVSLIIEQLYSTVGISWVVLLFWIRSNCIVESYLVEIGKIKETDGQ